MNNAIMLELDTPAVFTAVTCDGHWGIGATAEEAATNAIKAGARRRAVCSLSVVVGAQPGDVKIMGDGSIEYPGNCRRYCIPVANVGALVPKS